MAEVDSLVVVNKTADRHRHTILTKFITRYHVNGRCRLETLNVVHPEKIRLLISVRTGGLCQQCQVAW